MTATKAASGSVTTVQLGTQPHAPLAVRSHGLTHPGRKRPVNEDQFLIASLTHALRVRASSVEEVGTRCGGSDGHLFVIADGMGGHAGGQTASALAVHTIEASLLRALHWCSRLRGDDNELLAELRAALQTADQIVDDEARHHPELKGMGTTVTLAYVVGRSLFVAHAGDSRCYLLRGPKLYRVTQDHTLVREMVRNGLLTEAQAARHAMRHLVTNVIGGGEAGVNVELHKLELQDGDRLLLCSDGLTELVPEVEIASTLASQSEPHAACEHLVNRANELGGRDNITVIVAHCDDV